MRNNNLILTRTPTRLKVAPINNKNTIATVSCVEFNISTNLREYYDITDKLTKLTTKIILQEHSNLHAPSANYTHF